MPQEEQYSLSLTRRRALCASGLALVSGLAGCSNASSIGRTPTTEAPDWKPTSSNTAAPSYESTPEGDAARFKTPQKEIAARNLPRFEGIHNTPVHMTGHPDSRIAAVVVESQRVTVTLKNVAVYRNLRLTAYLKTKAGDWEHRQTTLDADHEQGADPTFTDRPVSFDISSLTLETHVSQHAVITIRDTADSRAFATATVLKVHTYLGLPYQSPNGRKVYWVNDESFNYTASGNQSQSPVIPQGYHHKIDHGNGDRTVCYGLYRRGAFWGAAVTIDKNEYDRKYRASNAPAYLMYEPYNATDSQGLQQFGREVKTALQKLDRWDDPVKRHDEFAFLIKMMEYHVGPKNLNPTTTLWDGFGDCSGKTLLHLAVLRTDAFENTTGAYFATLLNGQGHVTSAINIEDLGYTEETVPSSWYTLSFSADQQRKGAPDATYAFCEVTGGGARIGEYNPSVYSNTSIFDTAGLSLHPQYRSR